MGEAGEMGEASTNATEIWLRADSAAKEQILCAEEQILCAEEQIRVKKSRFYTPKSRLG